VRDHGRDNRGEVVLRKDFFSAIKELNPDAKDLSIEQAFDEISKDRSVLNPVNANKEIYELLKEGFNAKYENEDGDGYEIENVRLITKPDLKLNDKEVTQVKKVAKSLLKKIKEKLVIHWKRKQQAKADLRVSIEKVLDEGLPERAYDRRIFSEKCEAVYQHVFDNYGPEGESPYGVA
jgi:type I site-specific restriction-modification system R (restriction) subunit